MRILLLTIFLFHEFHASSQLPGLTGKLQDPSSGIYFSDVNDPFTAALNPAAVSLIKNRIFAFSGEKRFGLRSFNLASASLAIPVSSGCWSSQIDYFGFGHYAEMQLGITYAKSFGSRTCIGLRFNFFHLRISNTQSLTALYPQVGFRYLIHRDLAVGWSVSNPAGAFNFQGGRVYQPLVFRIGFGYRLSDVAAIAAEIMKEEGRIPGIVFGVRYKPIQGFSMRLGINTIAHQPFLNLGVQKNNRQYEVGLAWHQELGFSPTISGFYFF